MNVLYHWEKEHISILVIHDTYYENTGNITVGTSATSLTVYVEPNTVEVKFIVKDGTVLLPGATVQ